MPPMGPEWPVILGTADMDGMTAAGTTYGAPDPLFGDAGPAGGPPPGDMPPGDPAMGEPGPMDQLDHLQVIWLLQWMIWVKCISHMDDAAAHAPQDPGPGTPDPMAGDMDGDGMMPPPPTDDPVDDGMA